MKYHGDSFNLFARKKNFISIYRAALVRGLVNILVYLNK